MEKKQCEASIMFLNDSGTEVVFRCEREQGHRGKHQYSGVTFNSKFVLTWEAFAITKDYFPSGVILGTAQ